MQVNAMPTIPPDADDDTKDLEVMYLALNKEDRRHIVSLLQFFAGEISVDELRKRLPSDLYQKFTEARERQAQTITEGGSTDE